MDDIHPLTAIAIIVAMILTVEWAWRREKSLAAQLIVALGG